MNGVTYAMGTDNTTLQKMCTVKKEIYSLTIPTDKFTRYQEGRELIQNIFPKMEVDKREFIQSGWTPSEWDDMFKFEE